MKTKSRGAKDEAKGVTIDTRRMCVRDQAAKQWKGTDSEAAERRDIEWTKEAIGRTEGSGSRRRG